MCKQHIYHKFLFDYNMVNSTRGKEVFTPTPFFIGENYIDKIKFYSEEINKIVVKVIENIDTTFEDYKEYIPNFPLKDRILTLRNPLAPLLWARFDTFIREDEDDIFFAELNYDKPCAQREILIMEDLYEDHNNINNEFRSNLTSYIYKICEAHFPNNTHINIGFLTDATKYEETHLAMVIKHLVDNEKFNLMSVGVNNLFVEDEKLYAFDKSNEINVLMRLFPTEFLHEIKNIESILDLFEQEKILLLNDPRAIIGQCKNLYTYLWKLIEQRDNRLSGFEKNLIAKVFPKTVEFNENNISLARDNKNNYVIKPVYGRYSNDVFIGKLHSQEQWEDSIKYVKEAIKNSSYILQEFYPIKLHKAPYYNGNFTKQCDAFANLGPFIIGDKLIGTCVRWNESYLTSEETTWISPIVAQEKMLSVKNSANIDYKELYAKAVIDYGFSGAYVQKFRYLNTAYVVMDNSKFHELKDITNKMSKLFSKTQRLLVDNINIYSDILAITNQVSLLNDLTDSFTLLGRLDFILDINNQWKVLEINSETPAGICESINIDKLIYDYINDKSLLRANDYLEDKIIESAEKILKDYKKDGSEINTIACVGTNYYEDIYTFNTMKKILSKAFKVKVISGSIYDIKVVDETAYLYGEKVDCIFRYYPLDWLGIEKEGLKCIEKLIIEKKLFSLNPTNTIISQSKAFFAIIWKLMEYKYYSIEEEELIKKHIPYTTFDFEEMIKYTNDFVVKPLLNREGEGVVISSQLKNVPEEDCIFQELCHIQTLSVNVYDYKYEYWKENLYPVFGVYITDCEYAGIFTRIGSLITNNICMYYPVYVK
ncbi:glutathionylspermidine synthase family protein [Clostridium cellulovorans]|uniref:Glutathionylspermidine synthase n=1 Tax=Clostridium cellulovorans (strain ATCC 35296 / DSM 3052 / OCM 3 / 743B) TaxID=573061 RepID=D9SV76_CLOC7|nr:glutathionylspermidine synthase family protein [Clostridium cellulovorans]ADL53050.1 glutathionylspermidine synthase [Clostridium cellulovorans 743B]